MTRGFWLLGGAIAFVASAQAADVATYLLPTMQDTVAPQAQVLWDVGNLAYDDNGNVEIGRISEADWQNLTSAATQMKKAAMSLAEAPKVMVGPPGTKVPGEGDPNVVTAATIQSYIDADPTGFAEHSRALADVSDQFILAAGTRDADVLAEASAKLDEVCEGCHLKYWYPTK